MVFDVAVVGAGPTGCMAAYTAARLGLKTILIEEDKSVGRPLHCTGKLTARAFEEFNLPREIILNSVRGAYFYSPNNTLLTVSRRDAESHIINRESLDRWLAEKAVDARAELLTGKKCLEVTGRGGLKNLRLWGGGGLVEVTARLVVDAEGANPTLLKSVDVERVRAFVEGLQYEVEGAGYERDDYVEVYFGNRFAPGFFGWIVPLGGGKARVGLCVGEKAPYPSRRYLDNFIKEHPVVSEKLRGAKVSNRYGGWIPLHGPISRTYGEGLLIVGDAAGHTKSTSGGGVYFGLKAAQLAGVTLAECVETGDYSQRGLRRYEERWRATFGREIRFTSAVRRFLDDLSDGELDSLFRLLSTDEKFVKNAEIHGDTAYQSRLLKPTILTATKLALKNPSKLSLLLKFAVKGLQSILR